MLHRTVEVSKAIDQQRNQSQPNLPTTSPTCMSYDMSLPVKGDGTTCTGRASYRAIQVRKYNATHRLRHHVT